MIFDWLRKARTSSSKPAPTARYFIGALSGTSADGIDVGLVDFGHTPPRLVAFETFPFPTALKRTLYRLPGGAITLPAVSELQHQLNQAFSDALRTFLRHHASFPVTAIGFHGQTLWHAPDYQASWQLGSAAVLAAQTGVPVVSGFRETDLAWEGQGAPLAPLFHAELFADRPRPLATVNIGGIANVALITEEGITGWDTGPGNSIMDQIAQRYFQQPFDQDGRIARQGRVNAPLLAQCLQDPFFSMPPPKSTGREIFNLDWMLNRTEELLTPEDLMATACALTAQTIADALSPHAPAEVILCGGGAYNPQLRAEIAARLPGVPIHIPEELDCASAESIEAMLFAWLAWKRWTHTPLDYTHITGADRPAIYGSIWCPAPEIS